MVTAVAYSRATLTKRNLGIVIAQVRAGVNKPPPEFLARIATAAQSRKVSYLQKLNGVGFSAEIALTSSSHCLELGAIRVDAH